MHYNHAINFSHHPNVSSTQSIDIRVCVCVCSNLQNNLWAGGERSSRRREKSFRLRIFSGSSHFAMSAFGHFHFIYTHRSIYLYRVHFALATLENALNYSRTTVPAIQSNRKNTNNSQENNKARNGGERREKNNETKRTTRILVFTFNSRV